MIGLACTSNATLTRSLIFATGQAHLATRTVESAKHLGSNDSPMSDQARAVCRVAYELAQDGKYDTSLRMLQDQMPLFQGILKLEHRVTGFVGLVQLHRSLHRWVRLILWRLNLHRDPRLTL